jgi:hypothetical protein
VPGEAVNSIQSTDLDDEITGNDQNSDMDNRVREHLILIAVIIAL